METSFPARNDSQGVEMLPKNLKSIHQFGRSNEVWRWFHHLIWIQVCFVVLCCPVSAQTSSGGHGVPSKSDSAVVKEFNQKYQSFVDSFKAASSQEQRSRLIEDHQRQLTAWLEQRTKSPEMAKLLPELGKVRLLDLDDAIATVIDDHPDIKTRGHALLALARHSGNNGREDVAEAALAFLVKGLGPVRITDTKTFAQEAEEVRYYLRNLLIGKQAPKFAGEDVDGTLFRLEDYRGKVVMLRFWGDWCPFCRQMYDFERSLVDNYKNQPFALIGVNSDSREVCRAAQQRANLTWRSIWDGGNTRGPVSMIFRIKQWPTIIIIDGDGVIRYRSEGFSQTQVEQVIAKYVEQAGSTINAEE